MVTPTRQDLIFDAWTPMSFKRVLGNKRLASQSWVAPTWVGDHARRLQAYKLLQSYVDNAARFFLQEENEDKRDAHREYGDANLIVQTVLAALLGEDQQIVVEGAEEWDPDTEDLVEENGDDKNVTAKKLEAKQKWELQEWLRKWATDERLGLKMIETERNSITSGDGVYTLGIDNRKKRVRLRVFDAGFYFPVLVDQNEDEYPDRVHMAWELEGDKPDERLIRRITWELEEMPTEVSYPYQEGTSPFRALMSDGTWVHDLGSPATVEDFTESKVVWEKTKVNGVEQDLHDLPLGIDFLPVIHIPNSVAILNHFGRSILATVLQILDDISNADTDLQAASATTGTPPVALSGATMKEAPTYGPGKVWQLGANGKLDVLDTSKALDALLKYIEALLQRLSVNARVPESVLGRVDISGQLAGITLALSFGPLGALVKEMRLVRDEKYPLLLKFVWRMAKAAGWEGVPEVWYDAKVEFGSYLPQDVSAAVDMVQKLLMSDPPAISIETAVRILMTAGLPIDNAIDEVGRITGRDFKGAVELLDATGDEKAVFEYLGRKMPPDLVRPEPPKLDPTTGLPLPGQQVPVPGPNAVPAVPPVPPTPTQ
jgi:hypothetical protein